MPGGKIKFRFDILVARKTKIGLILPEEFLCGTVSHHPMAVITGFQFMNTSFELKMCHLLCMAFEAYIGPCLSALNFFFKPKDGSLSLCLCMLFSWTMAVFATLLLRRNFWVENRFPVGILPLLSMFLRFPPP